MYEKKILKGHLDINWTSDKCIEFVLKYSDGDLKDLTYEISQGDMLTIFDSKGTKVWSNIIRFTKKNLTHETKAGPFVKESFQKKNKWIENMNKKQIAEYFSKGYKATVVVHKPRTKIIEYNIGAGGRVY